MADRHNIRIDVGSTFYLFLTWLDSNGDPVDLSGYTARMQARAAIDSASTIFSATTENGYIVLGGALGTISVTIPAAVTEEITESSGVYDLELVNGSVVTRIIEGIVIFSAEVTR